METEGHKQIREIVSHIMSVELPLESDRDKSYPVEWDYINGVLSCEKLLGKTKLWLWWGEVRMVENKKVKKAGSMKILDSWTTNSNGTINLVGEKR